MSSTLTAGIETQNSPLGQVKLVEFDRASEWVLNVLQLLKRSGIQRATTLHHRVQSSRRSFNSNTTRGSWKPNSWTSKNCICN